jgi:HSP20 family protein
MKTNVPVRQGVTAPTLRTFNPSLSLRSEIDRMIDRMVSPESVRRFWPELPSTSLTPTMDVTETEKEYEVTAELPGLEERDVRVTLSDGVLTIRGEKKIDHEEKGKDFRMVERSYGGFSRSLELPTGGVDPNTIKATLEKGVLTVSIPKKAADVKKIEVKETKKEIKAAA